MSAILKKKEDGQAVDAGHAVLAPPRKKWNIRRTRPITSKTWMSAVLTWKARNPSSQRTIKTKASKPSIYSFSQV